MQSSTQHPTETQEIVAHVLGVPSNAVTVQCLRMGGGFGGKEMQPHGLAAVAALGATITGRPVRVRLTRAQDMTMTGKRHGFHATWRVGFDDDGLLHRARGDADLRRRLEPRPLRAGAVAGAVPHRQRLLDPRHRRARPGRADPQDLADRVPRLRRPAGDARDRGHHRPLRAAARASTRPTLRRRNFYVDGQATPYGQAGPAPRAAGRRLGPGDSRRRRSTARRAEIAAFNAEHPHRKRGLAITPVKFGISFNFTTFNQAGALVHVYKDGSVLINHGGTEMGQGLHTKMLQVAATALGLPLAQVRLAPTRTDKVPNTSATAASAGADLNGGAVKDACEQILERLVPVRGRASRTLSWDELVAAAYHQRIQLWAAGFYKTEGLSWDLTTMTGSPFKYFAYGVAAAEVEVDGFTGGYTTRRVDIVHDVGDSLSPLVDLGPDRGRLRAGRRLADPGGPALGRVRRPRPRAAHDAGGVDLQAAVVLRDADRVQRRPARAGRTRTVSSTAPRPSASRR